MKKNTCWHNQSLDICNKCGLKENNSALFSNLSNDSIDKISHCYSIIPSNEIIYKQNDTDHYMYAIKNGIIGLSTTSKNLKIITTELLTKGMIIGLENINDNQYRQDAISLTPISLCRIHLDKNDMETNTNLGLWKNITKKWEERYINHFKISKFTSGSTNERLISLLKFVSAHTYQENENRFFMISLKHISSIIKVSLENCSRALSKIKKDNFIKKVDKESFIFTNKGGITF